MDWSDAVFFSEEKNESFEFLNSERNATKNGRRIS